MTKITKFHGLSIAEARKALAYAVRVLRQQTIAIKTATIVQTQNDGTDIFSVCFFTDPPRNEGDVTQIEVTLFTEDVTSKNPAIKAVIGDHGQWILSNIA